MGYTHYMTRDNHDFDKDQWNKAILDFYKILPEYMDRLDNDPESSQCLKANTEEILFNGIGENSHETFYIDRVVSEGKYFNFCKTARKPYDIVVCVSMLIFKKHFPSQLEISSDGGYQEWSKAVEIVNDKLGYNIDNPFDL